MPRSANFQICPQCMYFLRMSRCPSRCEVVAFWRVRGAWWMCVCIAPVLHRGRFWQPSRGKVPRPALPLGFATTFGQHMLCHRADRRLSRGSDVADVGLTEWRNEKAGLSTRVTRLSVEIYARRVSKYTSISQLSPDVNRFGRCLCGTG